MLILTSCAVLSLFPEGILDLFFIYMLVYLGEQGPLAPGGPKTVLGKMMLKVGHLGLDQCLAKNQCSGWVMTESGYPASDRWMVSLFPARTLF